MMIVVRMDSLPRNTCFIQTRYSDPEQNRRDALRSGSDATCHRKLAVSWKRNSAGTTGERDSLVYYI